MRKTDFGENFAWGVSTAAYQVEGAFNEEGKGLSIWDEFVHKRGKTYEGQHADVSCDFYHRYTEDVRLLQQLHIPNFRFSFSWPRIFPNGVGQANPKGVDFYKRLIDHCLENGVTPWVTLYHWDLPLALHQKGGWANRDILGWFADYVEFCAKTFGDRVTHWMVLNEPMVFTGAGYFLGVHAPGIRSLKKFLAAIHHATLCQGIGGRILREHCPQAKIGTTYSCSYIEPRSQKKRDLSAAKRADALLNRLFLEPVLGLGYPQQDLSVLKKIDRFVKEDDEQQMPFDFDFIGVQNYTREIVRHSWMTPFIFAKLIPADKRDVPVSLMNWEVWPESVYQMLKQYSQYSNVPEIILTESGIAFEDEVQDGKVNDLERKNYIKSCIELVGKAKQEGIKVGGYFIWTYTDNFEWAEGYAPRFGIVYVDFDTQQRIVKSSGEWYSDFLKDS